MSPYEYVESRTGNTGYRTLKGEDFLWPVLQHVLPKGFRRVRDYGFLHGNAKKLLSLVQMVLQVLIEARAPRPRLGFKCPKCNVPMWIMAFRGPALALYRIIISMIWVVSNISQGASGRTHPTKSATCLVIPARIDIIPHYAFCRGP